MADRRDDAALVSRLASVHEVEGQDERASALLEPLRARLGTTDGARILGLADVRRGRVEPALALLRPYAHAHLESLRAAGQALNSAHRTAPTRNMDRLMASPIPFDRQGSQEEQVKRAVKYFDDLFAGDPEIEQARRRRFAESAVVPVALELGSLLLKHAQSQPDRKLRESELDEAEKLFLEVVRLTGEGKLSLEFTLPTGTNDPASDRLNLAEVRYWQGRPRDGRALIDEVARGAEPPSRYAVEG